MVHKFSNQSIDVVNDDGEPGGSTLRISTDIGWSSLLVDVSRCPSHERFETKITPDQSIIICKAGNGEKHFFDAGKWCSKPLNTDSVSLIPGGESHRVGWRVNQGSEPFERIRVFIPQGIVLEAADHFRRPGLPTPEQAMSAKAIRIGGIAEVGRLLGEAMAVGVPDIYAQATASWLAVHLLVASSGFNGIQDLRRSGVIADRRLNRAIEFMLSNLDAEISLDEIAVEAGVSKFHFGKLFRRQVGVTPVRFLFNERLDKAAKLLVSTNLSIKEVAVQNGFKNLAHFSRSFRERHRASPREFRQPRR